MNKIIITTLLVVLGGFVLWQRPTPPFAGATAEQKILDSIATKQATYFASHPKYEKATGTDKSFLVGIDTSAFKSVEVNEYVAPGGAGYQVILTRETSSGKTSPIASGSKETKAVLSIQTKSVGYGPEAQSRTWDWK